MDFNMIVNISEGIAEFVLRFAILRLVWFKN